MPATARDIQENSANVSSDVSDEEEMNEDDIHDNMSLEDQHQAENVVVGKVTALSKRLRSAAFIDAECMLNEIILSCNNFCRKDRKILSKR